MAALILADPAVCHTLRQQHWSRVRRFLRDQAWCTRVWNRAVHPFGTAINWSRGLLDMSKNDLSLLILITGEQFLL